MLELTELITDVGDGTITTENPIRSATARGLARLSYGILHGIFKGGSAFPGNLAARIDPDVLRGLARDYDVIIVTGTNGKTLTTSMIVKALRQQYPDLMTNPTGSNMMSGIISAFIAQGRHKGQDRGLAVLEVDEANVAPVSALVNVKAYVLTNIFRDQMDRYGEFYTTYQKILDGIEMHPDALVVANGDAPIFSSRELKNPMRYYGFDTGRHDNLLAPPNTDGVLCPRCEHILHYKERTYSNLGNFFCPNCGFARPELAYHVSGVTEQTPTSSTFTIDQQNFTLNIGGLYNVYNALAAYSVAAEFGVTPAQMADAFAYDEKVFGRQEEIIIDGKRVTLVLVKNPVGLNQVLDMIGHDDQDFALAVLLNANYADGIDTSWIWDGNFEEFVHDHQQSSYMVGGERYKDIELRMQVAGVKADALATAPDLNNVVDWVKGVPEQHVYLLTTYTAVLQMRKHLADGGYIAAGFNA